MDIESLLTKQDLDEIRSRAKEHLINQVIAHFHPGQVAAEVRKEAVALATREISEKVFRDKHVQQTLNRAINSVENRLNDRIHKMLKAGVSIKFDGLESSGN